MDEEQRRIARSLVWWKPPEAVERLYLLRRVMEMGTPAMLAWAWRTQGEAELRRALATAEAGNFSAPSWNYWHVRFGIRPTPPLPRRIIPETSPHVHPEAGGFAAGTTGSVAQAG